jgi:hypothetical protein
VLYGLYTGTAGNSIGTTHVVEHVIASIEQTEQPEVPNQLVISVLNVANAF